MKSIPTASALLPRLIEEEILPASTSEVCRRLGLAKWRACVKSRLSCLERRRHLYQDAQGAWRSTEKGREVALRSIEGRGGSR